MKTVAEVRAEFETVSLEMQMQLCEKYKEDTRSSVRKLVEKCRKAQDALQKEKLRMEQMMIYERKYEHLGYLRG